MGRALTSGNAPDSADSFAMQQVKACDRDFFRAELFFPAVTEHPQRFCRVRFSLFMEIDQDIAHRVVRLAADENPPAFTEPRGARRAHLSAD